MVSNDTITITARDVTGQRRTAYEIDRSSSVNELIDRVGDRMNLMQEDSDGRPITWFARHEREGRSLHRSEIVGEALRANDEIRLQPEISAGGTPT
jgi:hypothetical protein